MPPGRHPFEVYQARLTGERPTEVDPELTGGTTYSYWPGNAPGSPRCAGKCGRGRGMSEMDDVQLVSKYLCRECLDLSSFCGISVHLCHFQKSQKPGLLYPMSFFTHFVKLKSFLGFLPIISLTCFISVSFERTMSSFHLVVF